MSSSSSWARSTSPSHFTHRFRAAYGVTPREWRRHRVQDPPRTAPETPGTIRSAD
ncbi:helix-turn-helix transcriptional regulator [Streptomyces marianii]|uniref:helix-turn-helix transcriptional regulator n=1 Tax=Streptomyces marianii TaxID=1817406 RepID=UPI00389ADF7F